MYLWNKFIIIFLFISFFVSCQTSSKKTSEESLSFYIIDLGDREYKQGNFEKSQLYYLQAKKKNKDLLKNIFFISRLMKVAIKVKNPNIVSECYAIIKSFDINLLRNSFSKEIYHYSLGKYYSYQNDKKNAIINFSKAIELSNGKRDSFYQCLISDKNNC